MKVKGTAIKATRDFMRRKLPSVYEKWIDTLPPQSKSIYSSTINSGAWYPMNEGLKIPMDSIMKLCYSDDYRVGADEIGGFSAESALKGVYRVFILVASPKFLIQRASKIFTTYFDPSVIEVQELDAQKVAFKIVSFEGIDKNLEYRIAGWIRTALEFANCKEPEYSFIKSLAAGDQYTEIHFSWK